MRLEIYGGKEFSLGISNWEKFSSLWKNIDPCSTISIFTPMRKLSVWLLSGTDIEYIDTFFIILMTKNYQFWPILSKKSVFHVSGTLVPLSSSWFFFKYVSFLNIYLKKEFSTRESPGCGHDIQKTPKNRVFTLFLPLKNFFDIRKL